MLRILVVAAIAVFAAQFSSSARASTVQFNLTLTPTKGTIGGTGYFDVSAPVNGTGVNALTNFDVTIDGQQFTLGNDFSTATATFTDGVLTALNYVGGLISGFNLDILGTGGLDYAYLDIGTGAALATGTISAVDPPPATPLPSGIVLFATGLLGILVLNYHWRKKAACSPA